MAWVKGTTVIHGESRVCTRKTMKHGKRRGWACLGDFGSSGHSQPVVCNGNGHVNPNSAPRSQRKS